MQKYYPVPVFILILILPFLFFGKPEIIPYLLEASVVVKTDLGTGSGVVFVRRDKCYIWTVSHVVNEAKEIWVIDNIGRHLIANLIINSRDEDIALLSIPNNSFSHGIEFNPYKSKIGDNISHIGCPTGFEGMFSYFEGRISFSHRMVENCSYDQVQCSAFYGCSGGGVFNSNGECIGLMARFLNTNTHGMFLIVPSRRIIEFAIKNNVNYAINI